MNINLTKKALHVANNLKQQFIHHPLGFQQINHQKNAKSFCSPPIGNKTLTSYLEVEVGPETFICSVNKNN